MCKNINNIVVLESEEKKRFFKLEDFTRILSKIKGSYILTIFDCCREYVPYKDPSTRGLNGDDYDEDPKKYLHSDTNYIIVNGCAPNKTVPGYSFISRGFFDVI